MTGITLKKKKNDATLWSELALNIKSNSDHKMALLNFHV